MKIIISNPDYFVKCKGKIGMLFTPIVDQKLKDLSKILLHLDDQWVTVAHKSVSVPTIKELNKALLNDEELRNIAYENEVISISYQESASYLDYSSTYN